MSGKRQQKRFIYRCESEFVFDNITCRGIASDFSLSGLFMKTTRPAPPDTILNITIYLPDDSISKLKGKVRRAVKSSLGRVIGTPVKSLRSGMGVEIIQKDAHYLHFIRSLLG